MKRNDNDDGGDGDDDGHNRDDHNDDVNGINGDDARYDEVPFVGRIGERRAGNYSLPLQRHPLVSGFLDLLLECCLVRRVINGGYSTRKSQVRRGILRVSG